jgi:biopolymer transport protein ExbD
MKNPKNIALGIITLSLVILAGIAIYDKWSGYRWAKEAEAAIAEIERNKPARFQVEIPPLSDDLSVSPSLLVSVDSQGVLQVEGEAVGTLEDTSQMRAKIVRVISERNNKAVTVKASSKLKFSVVTKLMDEIRDAGADPVGLQVDALAAN